MALVWRKRQAGRLYEVRSAGRSLRLYTDGAFHSQFNPDRPLNGSIWDLLVLPALFRPGNIQRVLVLGVGGGAVIRQLKHFLGSVEICGVELDPVHIAIAERYFGLGNKKGLGIGQVSLVEADALTWLRRYGGPPFDLIIDDLFVENAGDPRRAVKVDEVWAGELCKRLSRSGVLVVNCESAVALGRSALKGRLQSGYFKTAFSLSVPGYDNRIGAFFRSGVTREDLAQNLRNIEARFGCSATQFLTARFRKISVTGNGKARKP